jgi:hypothetical protein
MAVYVGAPNCGGVISDGRHNVWFVRKYAEPAPGGPSFHNGIPWRLPRLIVWQKQLALKSDLASA